MSKVWTKKQCKVKDSAAVENEFRTQWLCSMAGIHSYDIIDNIMNGTPMNLFHWILYCVLFNFICNNAFHMFVLDWIFIASCLGASSVFMIVCVFFNVVPICAHDYCHDCWIAWMIHSYLLLHYQNKSVHIVAWPHTCVSHLMKLEG